MTHTLLAVAVGPVQDFIAAARKTRDLWFGSQVLSEISKATARALADAYDARTSRTDGFQSLVFPAPTKRADLDRGSELNVANVIVTEVPATWQGALVELVETAREAAKAEWKRFADQALGNVNSLGKSAGLMEHRLWKAQVDDVVEFYSAWVSFDDRPGGYAEARRRVMQLLAARKQCRDFQPAKGNHDTRIPKSSLDGARESVTWNLDDAARGRLRLRRNSVGESRFGGEQLDCVGLTKRLAGGDRKYPSVTRVAADPWIRGVVRIEGGGGRAELDAFTGELAWFADERRDLIHEVREQCYRDFRYEGDVVYSNRHRDFVREAGEDPDSPQDKDLKEQVADLGDRLKRLTDLVGIPDPYLAVLQADGDKVGAALSKMTSAGAHRTFSQRLAQFADAARGIVEDHRGVLVYAGGDDVLALLPVDLSVPCARKLHDLFGCVMKDAFEEIAKTQGRPLEVEPPTLSVGIAVGHMLEPMEYLRQYALEAEKHAKNRGKDNPSDGLAIHVHPRGGAPFELREKWSPDTVKHRGRKPVDRRLMEWVDLIVTDELSHRAAYELRELALTFKNWKESALADAEKGTEFQSASEQEREAIRRELREKVESETADAVNKGALYILGRKEGNRAGAKEAIRKLLVGVTTPELLTAVAHELLVARSIAAAAKFDPVTYRAKAGLNMDSPGGKPSAASPVEAAPIETAPIETAPIEATRAGKETP